MSQLDTDLAAISSNLQAMVSTLTTGASAGSLDAAQVAALQLNATAITGALADASVQATALSNQLAACQAAQGGTTPAPGAAPGAPLMVDAKAAALVALGALALGGFGGYVARGMMGGGHHAKRNPLQVGEASPRRLRKAPRRAA